MRDYGEIVRRNRAFIHMEPVDRPLLGIWIGSEMPLELYKRAAEIFSSFKGLPIVPEAINPKDFLNDYDMLFGEHEKVGDDLFWPAAPLVGFPWLEAICGAPVYASSQTYWTTPYLDSLEKTDEINFSPQNKWFQKLLEFVEILIEHAKERYPVATSPAPLRGPGDLMGAALGQERLCLELYDNPEKIKKLASIFTEIWVKVAEAQLRKIPKFHNGYVIAWYSIWTPDTGGYLQEDSLAYFSPKFYKEILLENHTKMAGCFKYSLMHLHPNSLYCIGDICRIENIKIIEVGRDRFGPSIFELITVLKEVQKYKPLLIWGNLTQEEIRLLLNELSPNGLCICPVVKTVEEGKTLLKKIKERKV